MSDRFLEDHRRPLGGYDHIHFDEAEIIALRSRIDLDTPLRVHWEWDYIREVESLRALYERGKKAQWNVETDIDWSVEIPETAFAMPCEQTVFGMVLRMMGAPEAMQMRAARDELAHGFSQLLHGEQAALQLTAQLVNTVPDMDAKMFAGQQVADECRHVEVFAKALARKFGEVHADDPHAAAHDDDAPDRGQRSGLLIGARRIQSRAAATRRDAAVSASASGSE